MADTITKEIKDIGLRSGADMVGVASAANVEHYAHGASPEKFLRGATNVVIALVADPPGIADAPSDRAYMSMAYAGYQKADGALMSMIDELRRRGYSAIPIVRTGLYMKTASGRMAKTLPMKQCAQAAGLGSIGLHSLLVNEKYGPMVRLSGLVTDAPLQADTPYAEDLCDNCRICARECPSGAIPETPGASLMLCSMYLFAGVKGRDAADAARRLDLGALAGEAAKFTTAAAGWAEALSQGRRLYYTCGNCIKVCRVHERIESKRARSAAKPAPAKKALRATGAIPTKPVRNV